MNKSLLKTFSLLLFAGSVYGQPFSIVKDMYPGGPGVLQKLITIGDVIYFGGNDGAHGIELCKSNGTEAGTVMLKDIQPGVHGSGPVNFVSFGGEACLQPM